MDNTQPVTVTLTFNPETGKFTVEYNGESEAFDSVDRALQEARGYLVGTTESEGPQEPEAETEKDFEEGFKQARGMPL